MKPARRRSKARPPDIPYKGIDLIRRSSKVRLAQLNTNWEQLCRDRLPGDNPDNVPHHPVAASIRNALTRGNPGMDIVDRIIELLGCTHTQLFSSDWNGQD